MKPLIRLLLLFIIALLCQHCGGRKASKNITIEFVEVPAGRFEMGDKWGTGDSDEKPVHQVKMHNFYLSKYEITVAQFREFVQATGYKTDADTMGWGMAWIGDQGGIVKGANWQKPGFDQADNHPVIMVSWNDAMAFCKYTETRLPSEAEWEYAARNGARNTLFPSGDSLTAADANGRLLTNADPFPFTSPVGLCRANEFGLHDMAGNAAEWCADWYDPVYYEDGNQSNPQGPSSGRYRVIRGGSFMDNRDFCRAVERNAGLPEDRVYTIGFRVALP
jgi:formylglycine-generating enzyme